jgi:hypothetical protein
MGQNLITAGQLMRTDTVFFFSPILNGMQHIPPPHFASHSAWQTEAGPTVNKLGQVQFQGHTACMRYMCRDITFGTPIVCVAVI